MQTRLISETCNIRQQRHRCRAASKSSSASSGALPWVVVVGALLFHARACKPILILKIPHRCSESLWLEQWKVTKLYAMSVLLAGVVDN